VHTHVNTTERKVVLTCTSCKRNDHEAQGCWFHTENKLQEASKMKSDNEDILKSKHSNKEAFMDGFVVNDPDEIAHFRGVVRSFRNSGEKGRRCGNCQYQIELDRRSS
jgi:hypothetical protein